MSSAQAVSRPSSRSHNGGGSALPGRSAGTGTGGSHSGKDVVRHVLKVLESELPGATLPDGSPRRDVTLWQLGLDSLAALALVRRLQHVCGQGLPRDCVLAVAATPHSVVQGVTAAPEGARVSDDVHHNPDEPFPLSATQRSCLPASAAGLASAPGVTCVVWVCSALCTVRRVGASLTRCTLR